MKRVPNLRFSFETKIIIQNRFQLYSKKPYTRTLNSEGQPAVGFYLMITNSDIRLLGTSVGS